MKVGPRQSLSVSGDLYFWPGGRCGRRSLWGAGASGAAGAVFRDTAEKITDSDAGINHKIEAVPYTCICAAKTTRRQRQKYSLLMARSVVDTFPVSPAPPPSSTVVAISNEPACTSKILQPPVSRFASMFISETEMADRLLSCTSYAWRGDEMGGGLPQNARRAHLAHRIDRRKAY